MVNKRSKSTKLSVIQSRREERLHLKQQGGPDPEPEIMWEVLAMRRAV